MARGPLVPPEAPGLPAPCDGTLSHQAQPLVSRFWANGNAGG